MRVLFVTGFSPIAPDPLVSRAFYRHGLALDLDVDSDEPDTYAHSERLDGVRHFGVWPLSSAAKSCFGRPEWPGDVPVPQAVIEFEVEDVDEAAEELRAAGHRCWWSR